MSDSLSELNERVHRLEEQRPVIADLKSRVSRLERTIEQVHNLEVSLAKAREIKAEHAAGHDGQYHLPPEIGEIIKNLDNPLEGVRRTFSCTRCGTKNRVAVQIKCTACDTNSWLGWWPERRPRAAAAGAGAAAAGVGSGAPNAGVANAGAGPAGHAAGGPAGHASAGGHQHAPAAGPAHAVTVAHRAGANGVRHGEPSRNPEPVRALRADL